MKVLLVNGSPHREGNTFLGLTEIANTLREEGIESSVFQIGTKPVSGCIACGSCARTGSGLCAIDGDPVNDFIREMETADGLIVGSPVHFAGAASALAAFLDRAFYACPKELLRLKPAAPFVVARRAGTTAALDQLNKYFLSREMPVIASRYWNMVHGRVPGEVLQDEEGLQTLRTLARNMAWFLRCKEAAAQAGIPLPKQESPLFTPFVR